LVELTEHPVDARTLNEHFASLGAILAASEETLAQIVSNYTARRIRMIRNALAAVLHEPLVEPRALPDTEAVARFLVASIGYRRFEELRVLYLDSTHRLIRQETAFRGCIDQCHMHARPIITRALELGAKGLILSHNHPSGLASPSRADIEATRRLSVAARSLDFDVIDHIIVARDQWYSFRAMGHM
jgi:DNA repair protein RadC